MTHPESAAAAHREVLRLMQARDWRGADAACRRVNAAFPRFAPAWFAASHIAMAQGAGAAALDAIDAAVALEPGNAAFRLQRGTCLLALQRRGEALEAAEAALACAPADPGVLDAVGTLRSRALDHRRALEAYDGAVALAPRDARFRFNRASVRRFVGDLEGAEADYDRVIELQPLDHEAYLNRSELRVQTAARNHVAELEALAARPFADWRGEVQVRYALAKECEDLGDFARSFAELRRGADQRRAHMNYDVAMDVSTVDWIIEAFPGDPAPGGTRAGAADSPIFIVGLPRSGTTLAERILGSHSEVSSAGELDSFALALVEAARRRSGAAPLARRELVTLSATLDFDALGRDYLRRARGVAGGGRFIDKMPLNYLYCGLILRALPQAKIVHMTRHPMAAGYAMYKTLFKDGYPFSYDLTDIGRYYVAYRRLMDHWRRTLPGAIHELSYEDLVCDQDTETRRLLGYCGLEWQDACAQFHRNPAPTTTASAAQVRRPIYDSSVAQWRHYGAQLGVLRDALASAGIAL
ncbi:MAG: sulfotransferase [Steroidobacteraceae bacterium]|jgi:tetratricopeptide (TPR) repeat protein